MRILRCQNCNGKKYLKDDEEVMSCPYCKHTFIQIYENDSQLTEEEIDVLNSSENQKEDNEMVKEKITEKRIANANKVLEFITTLEVEDKEVTKILCRATRIFKEQNQQ